MGYKGFATDVNAAFRGSYNLPDGVSGEGNAAEQVFKDQLTTNSE